jgi:hypothetical protein
MEMAYKIVYGGNPKFRKFKPVSKWHYGILVAILVCGMIPEVRGAVRAILMPPQYTEPIWQAWMELETVLEQGAGFEEAVTVFCKHILYYAEIAG